MSDETESRDDHGHIKPTTQESALQGQGGGHGAPPRRSSALGRNSRPLGYRVAARSSLWPLRRPASPEGWVQRTRQEWIMVVAVLIALVTYHAGLNPPGGTWQADTSPEGNRRGHAAGDPIMRDKNVVLYGAFWACNSVAFASCLAAIVVLLDESAFHKYRMLIVRSIVRVNVVVMGIAYAVALPLRRARERLGLAFIASIVLLPLVWSILWGLRRGPKEKQVRDLRGRRFWSSEPHMDKKSDTYPRSLKR